MGPLSLDDGFQFFFFFEIVPIKINCVREQLSLRADFTEFFCFITNFDLTANILYKNNFKLS